MWDQLPPECLMLIMEYYMKTERVVIYDWDKIDIEPLSWSEWLSLDIHQSSDDFENTEAWIIYKINKLMGENIIRLCKGIESSTSLAWPTYVIKCARITYSRKNNNRYIESDDWRLPLSNYRKGYLYDTPTKYNWKEPDFKKYLNFISISHDTLLCCDKPEVWACMYINDMSDNNFSKMTRRKSWMVARGLPLSPKYKYLYTARNVLIHRYSSISKRMRKDITMYRRDIDNNMKYINILKTEIMNELSSKTLFNVNEDGTPFPELICNERHMVNIPHDYTSPSGSCEHRRRVPLNIAVKYLRDHEKKIITNTSLYNNIRDVLSIIQPIQCKLRSFPLK